MALELTLTRVPSNPKPRRKIRDCLKKQTRYGASGHYINWTEATTGELMAMNSVLRHLRRAALLCAAKDLADAQLLESFLVRREEAAFETLLRRHGPMVLGVCRRILRNYHDAEDAFQATFLVLARKAGSVRSRQVLASWLYGVAYRTSLKARAMRMKRRVKERHALQQPRPVPMAVDNEELLARLDDELHRLPEKFRVPVILCELEGKSRREAARILGWPEGTLSCRLAQARKMLARRLARDADGSPGGAVVAVLAQGSVPPSLLKTTAHAAAGGALTAEVVSAEVMALVDGVLKTMLLSKLKVAGLVVLVVALAVPVGLTYSQERPGRSPADPSKLAPQTTQPAADDLDALRLEFEALRKEVRALRERIRLLERAGQARGKAGGLLPDNRPLDNVIGADRFPRNNADTFAPSKRMNNLDPQRAPSNRWKAPDDVIDEAERSLHRLRTDPDDTEAAEQLERALRRVKERGKSQKRPEQPKRS